jgi:hypothetical protein
MIGDELELPFETSVLGMAVAVTRVDLSDTDEIIAICQRDGYRQAIPILDPPLPTPAPGGAEWIEAYRSWLG